MDSDKVSTKASKVGKATASAGKNLHSPSQSPAIATELLGSASSQNQLNVSETSAKKKHVDSKMAPDASALLVSSGVDPAHSLRGQKDLDKQKTSSIQPKNLGNNLKDVAGALDVTHKKFSEKTSGKPLNNVNGKLPSGQSREKKGTDEHVDQSISGAKYPMQSVSNI